MSFEPSLPQPYSTDWRKAYQESKKTEPRMSSYQAPNANPVAFIFDSMHLSGGQSVDTAEYPYFGFWSNTPLNSKPHGITLNGHFNGDGYIQERNALVTALQVKTDDDSCGYLDLPLWGRFPVVVQTWNIDEDARKSGAADISITFTRAGLSDASRLDASAVQKIDISGAARKLKKASINRFRTALVSLSDTTMLDSGMGRIKSELLTITGRVQAASALLNNVTNKINGISTLIAQGIRTPALLAQAVINAAYSVAAGVMESVNAAMAVGDYFDQFSGTSSSDDTDSDDTDDTVTDTSTKTTKSEQFTKNNLHNALVQFLSADTFTLDDEAITEAQQATKAAVEELYKETSFASAAQLLCSIDGSTTTHEKQTGLWKLFQRLEDSLNLEDSDTYAAVEELRIAAAQTLLSQNAAPELTKEITSAMPVLALALVLGCTESRIRDLNKVADSFLIKGNVLYV